MPLDLEDFEKVGENGAGVKYEREMRTPLSTEDGYDYEENTMTVYHVKDRYFKVAKVSDKGWGVTEYAEDKEVLDVHGGYFEEESEAHEKVKELITNVN